MTGSLRRLLPAERPVRRTMALAVLAGTATICFGVGLFATAGWLIARAAEHPAISTLSLAVVAVPASAAVAVGVSPRTRRSWTASTSPTSRASRSPLRYLPRPVGASCARRA